MSYGYGYQQAPVYQPGYTYNYRRSAPASVHVVAVLQYLGGLLVLGMAAVMALVGSGRLTGRYFDDIEVSGGPDAFKTALYVMAGMSAFIGLCAIVLGRKVQRGRNWARIILIVLCVLSVCGTLYQGLAVEGQPRLLTGLFVPVLYLILLNTRAARGWCKYGTY